MTSADNTAADTRAIRLETAVPGTPEEVWQAIATGPGISTWFVPAEVDGRLGGEILLEFGPGLKERGTITTWEPPHRFAYQDESERRLAYEFVVEARSGDLCVVRLINSGFGEGANWDHEIESMTGGWKLFLHMLTLGRTHFPGQRCASAIVNGVCFITTAPRAIRRRTQASHSAELLHRPRVPHSRDWRGSSACACRRPSCLARLRPSP